MGTVLKFPVVVNETFIEATRDTGYRSTASAVAELVDNALQAGATAIHIRIAEEQDQADGLTVSVIDNGSGMDTATLRRALQFGGSGRFNDRSGPGRFGMGLPNSSVSQARRVDVLTWQQPSFVYGCYLDVDEIAAGHTSEIPPIKRTTLPEWCTQHQGPSGTLVQWSRCDRLDAKRVAVVIRKLAEPLGRAFRRFIWRGVKLTINDEPVVPIDPLFLHESSPLSGATLFNEPLLFELHHPHEMNKTATVAVRFAELPIEKWYDLSVDDKRRLRIVGGAGISIVRADREIDYGWYFFGPKRKENYDDWWRCELSFGPELDEMFGVNHSKQGISPTGALREALTPDMEAVARTLNQRVQAAFSTAKAKRMRAAMPKIDAAPKLQSQTHGKGEKEKPAATKSSKKDPPPKPSRGIQVETQALLTGEVFEFTGTPEQGRLVINTEHEFYKSIYEPLAAKGAVTKRQMELLLLAFVWAERGAESERHRSFFRQHRFAWGDRLAELLENC
jgi:hypothetical protein